MKGIIYKTLRSVLIISVLGIIAFKIGFLDTVKDCIIVVSSAVIAIFSENIIAYINSKKNK